METFIVIIIVSAAALFLWRKLKKKDTACSCDGCADHECAAMMERLSEIMPPECTDNTDTKNDI